MLLSASIALAIASDLLSNKSFEVFIFSITSLRLLDVSYNVIANREMSHLGKYKFSDVVVSKSHIISKGY
jgi:hypothetical protein